MQHNLRYYPVVQQIRQMIAHGDLGDILIVQGTYSQDWLLYDTDWNWRVDAEENGKLRAMGDIGSHWMDMIQHLTGFADHGRLRRSRHLSQDPQAAERLGRDFLRQESFSPATTRKFPITTEDFGAVLIHLGDRARGAFTVSQMSAGCKNRFAFEIFGTKAGVAWDQEQPDTLWIGHRNDPNQIIIKDASLFYPAAANSPICPAATAKATTIRTNRFSSVFTPESPIRRSRSTIRPLKTVCAAWSCSKK